MQIRWLRNQTPWKSHLRITRRQLLVLPGLATLWLILIFPGRESAENVRSLLMLYGQVLVPPLSGWIAAGLLLTDPCRELLLTMPRPTWRILMERIVLLLVTALLSWGLLFVLVTQLIVGQPLGNLWFRLFIGALAPTCFFAALGLWGALRFHTANGGGLLVASVWGMGLIFRQQLLTHPIGESLHPFLLLEAPDSPLWPLNSLSLSLISILLTANALQLTGFEEPLLPTEETEESLE